MGFNTFDGGVCIECDAYNWGKVENRTFIRRRVGDWKFLCHLRDIRHRVQVTLKIIRFLNRPHPISEWFFFVCLFWPGKRKKRDSVAFSGFFSLMSEINFYMAFSNFRIWLSAKWYENIITAYTNIVLAHLGTKISRFNYHFKATDSKWGKKRHDIQIYNKRWRSYFKTKGKKIKYWWCLGAKRKLDNYFSIWYLHFID